MKHDFIKTTLIALFLGGCVNVDNPLNNDEDGDGVSAFEGDCDDAIKELGARASDGDCDGVLTVDDCDDSDASTVNDMDCDGVLTADDCDDGDSTSTIKSEDGDCDGVLSVDDCDDSDDLNMNTCMTISLSSGLEINFVAISGSNLNDPLGRYTLSHAFYMMTTEVTQGMFQEVMGYDSRDGKNTNYGDGNNFPAYYVSWHMAAHFANTLSILEGEQECYSCSGSGTSVTCSETMDPYLCTGYSLPTEHEWEIAARSGTTSDFWTGEGSSLGGTNSADSCDANITIQDGVSNPSLSDYAWFCLNSSYSSQEVGTKLPNGFGLYDMHGNLWEWTSDWYGCAYPNSGTWCNSGSANVARGGYWGNIPIYLRSSTRNDDNPSYRGYNNGFRLRKLVNP